MSASRKGTQKEVPEDDFETYIRNCLTTICEDLTELKGTQIKIQKDIETL